jgi:hypothetical protein
MTFDWPSKKREIAEYKFKPRIPSVRWVFPLLVGVVVSGILLAASFIYFHETVVEPWLDTKTASAAEMTDAEICANLGRFINGEEFEDYCAP